MQAPWRTALLALSSVVVTSAAEVGLEIVDGAGIYQQTAANPCVFGGENCLQGTFPDPLDMPTGGSGEFDGTAIYGPAGPNVLGTYAQFTAVAGATFIIGVDLNQTNEAQTIESFTITFNDINNTTYVLGGVPNDFPVSDNGVGFSDYLIRSTQEGSGGDIFVPDGATQVTFTVAGTFNDGHDRFFLIPTGEPSDETIPEPSTITLMAAGLVALGYGKRRNRL